MIQALRYFILPGNFSMKQDNKDLVGDYYLTL